jgi:hypothetical protein
MEWGPHTATLRAAGALVLIALLAAARPAVAIGAADTGMPAASSATAPAALHRATSDAPAMAMVTASPAATHEWRFAVSLDSIPIGEHRYVVSEDGDTVKTAIDARFRVRVVVVDAYAWEQHVDETWHGDCLVEVRSRTVDQGRVSTVAGREQDGRFLLQRPTGEAAIPACPMTFAYWNPRVLERRELLNVQTGLPTPVEVERLDADVQTVRGKPMQTQHYRMRTPRNSIELWYSPAGDWVGMRTTTADGHVLVYRLV